MATVNEIPKPGSFKLYIKGNELDSKTGTYKKVARTFNNVRSSRTSEQVHEVAAAIASLYYNQGETITSAGLEVTRVENTLILGIS